MMKTMREVREAAAVLGPKRIAVAAAEDGDVLEALKMSCRMKLAEPVLFGDGGKIKKAAERLEFNISSFELVDEPDQYQAALKAAAAVRRGEADIIMKGLLGTSTFLKAVLDKENGLRAGSILSHVSVFEVPRISRLLILTDCAMNIAPGLREKVQIINNAVRVAGALKISPVRVAAVGAVETVNQDMPATLDAALLAKMSERGQIRGAVVDGPLALDNAVSAEAARHKGIDSPVAGVADIILLPDIEAGNIMYKTLVYLSEAESAGVVMGACAPVVLTSRADPAQAKLNSIALSLVIASAGAGA
ncbi:MAG: phosphate butyryltransferase [Peptococcaceae bacterium]|jgi:phosphate butyryltransferase|nr:phosphate butyryltransferase [Peptococcaceae bacterium]MDH7525062.1 phosphate butyryltransferase [Peptococcaceae bacterium]